MSTNRHVKGSPIGGQFAPGAKAAADASVSLGAPQSTVEDFNTNDLAQVATMLHADQPVAVRAAAARTVFPGVGRVAANDPDPLIRALALSAWDLPAEEADRLERDADVTAVLEFISR